MVKKKQKMSQKNTGQGWNFLYWYLQESVRDESELDDTVGVNLHATGKNKAQSMVSIKAEKIERAKSYRRVMVEEKMLGNFIRLADYIFVEHLSHRCVTSTEELLGMLEICRSGMEKSPKGVFTTAVSFGPTTIEFVPNERDIIAVSSNLITLSLEYFFLKKLLLLFNKYNECLFGANFHIIFTLIFWFLQILQRVFVQRLALIL